MRRYISLLLGLWFVIACPFIAFADDETAVDNSPFFGRFTTQAFDYNAGVSTVFTIEVGDDAAKQATPLYLYVPRDKLASTYTAIDPTTGNRYLATVAVIGRQVKYAYIRNNDADSSNSVVMAMSLGYSDDYNTLISDGFQWDSTSEPDDFHQRVYLRDTE